MADEKKGSAQKKNESVLLIREMNHGTATISIVGTAPYVQNKFSAKQRIRMMDDMATPRNQKKARTARPPRNYEEDYKQAQHVSSDGWNGIPCAAFRAAMIDACRTVGLMMTRSKMALFVVPDGIDADDGTPLVRIIGEPEQMQSLVRNDNGSADIRIRPMWRTWAADVRVDYDEEMITKNSVFNLMNRAGRQVGIGEGRPYSKNSVGQGWGTFTVVGGLAPNEKDE